jgi:hypothetical protein
MGVVRALATVLTTINVMDGTPGIDFQYASRPIVARQFARAAAQTARAEWRSAARLAVTAALRQSPQQIFHPLLQALVADFVKMWEPADQVELDYEGAERVGPEQRNYWLFGAMAQPDAAVLRPFRCAIEYDLQPPRAPHWSAFRRCLGKTVLHVLSGAYDAALQVYVLTNPSQKPEHYWTTVEGDDDPHHLYTRATLSRLHALGVYVAVIAGY